MIEDLIRKGSAQISIETEDGGGPPLTWREIWEMKRTYLRSAFLGTLIGIIPGAGANIACFVGYAAAKQASKTPEQFGTGIAEGVAASEAANNGVCNGSLVPLLTLSIPGSPTAAVILGALMIHGMVPGADLFTKHAEVTYTFIASAFFCNIIMLFMGWYGSRWFCKLVQIPNLHHGAGHVTRQSRWCFYDSPVHVRYWRYHRNWHGCLLPYTCRVPHALDPARSNTWAYGEAGFRRAMLIGHNDLTIFLTRPLSLALVILTLASVVIGWRMQKKTRALEAELKSKS